MKLQTNTEGKTLHEAAKTEVDRPLSSSENSSEMLWKKAAPNSTWRDCPSCGKVPRPHLKKQVFKDRTRHLCATCPTCHAHLGFLKHVTILTNPTRAQLRESFRSYRAKGRLNGYQSAYAAARFKATFGYYPDPSITEELPASSAEARQ